MKTKLASLLILTLLLLTSLQASADTIGRYAEIIKGIPEATLKADEKSQAWAHSARTILAVAEESITETILSMHNLALKTKSPLFCLPQGQTINIELIHQVLMKKTENLAENDANRSLSEVAVESISAVFPCNTHSFKSAQNELFAPKDYQIQSVSR